MKTNLIFWLKSKTNTKQWFSIFPLVLVLIFLSDTLISNAEIVTRKRAKEIAQNFYFERANQIMILKYNDIVFSDPITISDSTKPIYYLFNLSNSKGFIIVSAEDVYYPVLAYSFERSFDLHNIAPGTQNIINGYVNEIKYLRNNFTPQCDSIKKWWTFYSIFNDSLYLHQPKSLVTPLIQTEWTQDEYYNDSCPGECDAGCVAIAMAQIMKYYNYPVHGIGQHCYIPATHPEFGQLCANFGTTDYQWENMPNELVFSTPQQNAAVAQLIYHCGVGVDMDYCSSGWESSAYSWKALNAFKTHFNYDQNAQLIYHSNYSNYQWDKTIRNELDAGRPLYYAGTCLDTLSWYYGNHAFICDGYQNNNFFHFNFGWGGSNNGYFYSSTVYYNNYQAAIVGIKLPGTQNVEFAADSTTIHLGSLLNFQDLSSGNPTQWSWSFPGGTPSTSHVQNPQNIHYNSFGSYDVKLIVITPAGIDSVRKVDYITVKQFNDIDPECLSVGYGSLALCDYNNDGILDVTLCGVISDTTGVFIYNNDGAGHLTNNNVNISGALMSSISWGDYDNDGDLDLAICGGTNYSYNESAISKIYRNDGNGVFTDINAPLTGVCFGTINWIDYDNDGDLDILLTGQKADGESISCFYLNKGNNDFESKGNLGLPGCMYSAIDIADYNYDGTLDILLSSWIPKYCRIYRNTGGVFHLAKNLSTEIGGKNIKWIDYDQNGDMDVLVSGELADYDPFGWIHDPSFKIFKNYGNNNFVEITSEVPSIDGWIGIGDADNDGDLDLVLSGRDSSYSCKLLSNLYKYQENYSFEFAENFVSFYDIFSDYTVGESQWGDIDNDGDMDIIQFSRGGIYPQDSMKVMIRKNEINVINTKPNPPTGLVSTQIGIGQVQLSWNRGTDAQTLQNALTYNVYVGTTPGSINVVSPMADLSNGFRRIVDYGNATQDTFFILNNLESGEYFWSVQSIDNSFAGSDFAQEQNFNIQSFITVTSPNGGENWHAGSPQTITWNDNISENVRIQLYKGDSLYSTIAFSTSSDGSYSWAIPTNQQVGIDYKIKITCDNNNNVYDLSNNYFTISSQIFTLVVMPSNINVPAVPSGSTTFNVTSNCNWTASSNQDWCTVTPSGSGNGTIVANYSENNTANTRTADITVTASGGSPVVIVTVTQGGLSSAVLTIENTNSSQLGAVVVPVHAFDIANLGFFQFSISYDNSKLTYIKDTNWFPGINAVTINPDYPGKVSFVWAADEPINIPDNTFFEIKFDAFNYGSSNVAWTDDPTPREFGTWDGEIFVPAYNNGIIDISTGINEHSDSVFIAYPNPVRDFLFVELPQSSNDISRIEIINPMGVIIFHQEVKGVASSPIQINTKGIPDGLYLLRVIGKTKFNAQRVIVLH